jgi:hypothetical protein
MNANRRFAAVAAALVLWGCDSSSNESFTVTYDPDFDPSSFVAGVDNSFFPLAPGATYRYVGETDEGTEEVTVEVTSDTREIAGVTATVVHASETLDGKLIEDTFDWFAQDDEDNVWYLGEETCEYEGGVCVSTAGSWEAGVDGAEAGILMPGAPAAGQAYYQEFYEGEAEDRAVVVSTNASATVPAGSFTGCVQTLDTTPLEPSAREHKFYCPGVGLVLEVDLGSGERVELVEISG